MALREALYLSKAGIEGHGRMVRVLGKVEVGRSAELLFYYQALLKKLPKIL